MSWHVVKRAQAGMEARAGFTLTLELFIVAEDDVVDVRFRVGKLHPYTQHKRRESSIMKMATEVLDVVGSYQLKLALRLYLSSVGKQSTMISQPPRKSLNLLSTGVWDAQI